jgi:hypothetical protein
MLTHTRADTRTRAHLELAARVVRDAHVQQCVEAPRAQQRGVEQVWPVGGADDEQAFAATLRVGVMKGA